jgi:predicted MPP superfamily phosphohydrolase
MWVYLLLLFVILILLILSIIYIVRFTHNKLEKYIKNKIVLWIVSFIPILLLALGIYIDSVNAIVVDIHLIVIVFLTKIIFHFINKDTKDYLVLGIGIIVTTIILSFGYYQAHHVVETNYVVYTDKAIGVESFKIVQISDSHLSNTLDGKKFSSYIEKINELNPDIVVITGDFIDDNTSVLDMTEACNGLANLKTKYGVYFVNGNHDKGYYSHDVYMKLKKELVKSNVHLLEDTIVDITDNIVLIGRNDREFINRVTAQNLTKDLDKSKYIIMLDHQPNDYDNEAESGADLVLSGHTHGGQLFPLGLFGVLLGSNDKTYGIETRDNTTFIVNSGISDWAIKFKTGTKSEYGVITIKTK